MSMTHAIAPRHPLALAVGIVLAAFIALGSSGCATNQAGPGPSEPPVAEPATAVDCRTEGSWMLPDAPATPDPAIPVPGRVPDGFEAAAALRCTLTWPTEGAAGADEVDQAPVDPVDAGVVAQVERLEGDLTPLLAALAEPDDPVPTDIVCTADLELVAPLWLEGVDGSLIPVHYPRDACGKTKAAVHDALAGLEVVSVEEVPVPPTGG